MSKAKFWTQEALKSFDITTIVPEQIPHIDMRLVNMSRRGNASTYLIMAMPNEAKVKHGKMETIVFVWPEVCIGMIGANHGGIGQTTWWDIFPHRRRGTGFRHKSIAQIPGREAAATNLLIWWSSENAKRRNKQPAAVEAPERDDLAEKMFDAYMLTYDSFATDIEEVMSELDIPRTMAKMIYNRLLEHLLICDDPKQWQCFETYDSLDRLQAIDLYVEHMGDYAKRASDKIAAEMTRTRKEKIDTYGRIK